MSWHYLQGQEEASWEGSSLVGAPSALLKLIPTPDESCSPDKPTDALSHSRYGMTLRRSTGTRGAGGLTWFLGGSHVRTYRQQEKEQDSTASGLDCGPSLPGSLAKCNPPMSGWKTRQCSLFGGLTEFCGTWPRWGMMRDGELLELATPVLHTSVSVSGSRHPTPTATDWKRTPMKAQYANRPQTEGCPDDLAKWAVRRSGLEHARLVPALWLWEMGWPQNWTKLGVRAMDKFQAWCASHGICSHPQKPLDTPTRRSDDARVALAGDREWIPEKGTDRE
jgi:hypothetical protein